MKVERTNKENKLILLIAIVILIGLLILIINKQKGNEKVSDYKTMNCLLETEDVGELTSNVSFKYTDDTIASLSFNYLYVYTDNAYLLSLQYEEAKEQINLMNTITGINASVNYDAKATLLEIKGTVDYAKIDKSEDLLKPYAVFARKDLTKYVLTTFLDDEGYTCEEASE